MIREENTEVEREDMMLSFGAMVVPYSYCYKFVARPMCCSFSNTNNTDQLRSQLDQLHTEAETTRAKANNARLRLLRLSEAAEKLQRQAAVNVRTGKENDARELLFQKKRIMQALENSKSRIELLDELSTKLNEAISLKETQLIGNVASDLELERNDVSTPIHIVSPKEDNLKVLHGNEKFSPDPVSPAKNLEVGSDGESQENLPKQQDHLQYSGNTHLDMVSSFDRISSYEDFLERLDLHLKKMEEELVTIQKVSTIISDSLKSTENIRLQQTAELLESITDIRKKISRIMQPKVETR